LHLRSRRIAKPRGRTPAPIFNALPDLAPVVHRVDNNYSPKWRWLASGEYLPRPRVSIQGVPKVSCTITFGQKFIFT